MRRKLTFLVTLWWVILCGVLGACLLLFTSHVPVISKEENRMLAGMPTLSLVTLKNGDWSESFEQFLTDQFFLRSEVVDAATAFQHVFSTLTVDELLSGESDEAFVPVIDNPDETEEAAAVIPAVEAEQTAEETTDQSGQTTPVITGESASVWLNHLDGTQTALFTYQLEDIQKAAQTINELAALLPEDGRMHVLLAPRSQTANKLALHLDTESGWSSETEDALTALVSENVSIHSAYDVFEQPILRGAYVYFRTDHHWTALGAYLAAQTMLEDGGYQTIPLEDYTVQEIDDFLGSIYLHGRSAKLKELVDRIDVYEPLLPAQSFRVANAYPKNELPVIDETQTNYLVFFGGTYGPYRYVDGGYQTGRNMLMICDSFGNSIAPFFMPYYDKVYMVDFRPEHYDKDEARGSVKDYVSRCGIDDIYIVLSDSNGIGSLYFNRLIPENID